MSGSLRLGVICDFAEEDWPSMDLCGDKLLAHWPGSSRFAAVRIRPALRVRLQHWPVLGRRRGARNVDRLLNRFVDYPRHLRRSRSDFDFFHLVDHSYSQILHVLPAARTGIFCHDLDTFRCVLRPDLEPRPAWFRAMARRILNGFRRASVVFHTTAEIARQIVEAGLIAPERLVAAPLGVDPAFQPLPPDARPLSTDDPLGGRPFVLHVGSTIPRKRIDVLLRVLAGAKERIPALRLVQMGGQPTPEQSELARSLGVSDRVTWLGRQPLSRIVEGYRRATVVLQPSEAEGFGLPVAEALACGARVLASDIPTLREVGGDAVTFAPVADVPAWVGSLERLLRASDVGPDLPVRLARAGFFSWDRHAAIIESAYARMAGVSPVAG